MYQDPRTSLWWTSYKDENGHRQRASLQTRTKAMAEQFEAMLKRLMERGRWDVVDLWRQERVTLQRLYRAYEQQELPKLLEELEREKVPDLSPLVEQWVGVLDAAARRGDMAPDTVKHYELHVRTLIPEGRRFAATELTKGKVQRWLDGLPHKSGTKRKYFMALKAFVGWLLKREILEADPLAGITPPKQGDPHVEHLEAAELKELLLAAEPKYKDAIAVAFASGIEANVLAGLRVRDVNLQSRMIHAAGTKNGYRSRWVRVADWCWPTIERLVQGRAPHHRLFPVSTRQAISKALRRAADRIGRTTLTLHKARNTFAVRLLKEGTPARLVAEQLGHADEQMVMRVYGQWITRHEEYDRYERKAAGAWTL